MEYEEMVQLANWLNAHSKLEIPAVQYLFRAMLKISADGVLTNEEIFELQLAIERVVPKVYRTAITQHRLDAYYDGPATERQLDYLRCLGGGGWIWSRREGGLFLIGWMTLLPTITCE